MPDPMPDLMPDVTSDRCPSPMEEPVARPEKVAVVDEVAKALDDSGATLLTHFTGITVSDMAELRVKLRAANAEMRVVKNTLTRRAAAKAGIEGLDELLIGPTSLVFCEEDPVGPAKALKEFAKDHPGLVIRGGYLDGAVLSEAEAAKLAELASREELLATLAGLLYGALANTARLLQAPIEQQARLLQALVDAGGGADEAAAPEAAPAEPQAADEAAAETADEAGDETADEASADATDEQPEAGTADDAGDASEPAAADDQD
jgi:large subunit ribosomal protein L10